MIVLKCDICGSKLVMQVGGVAVCDCCGVEYSTRSLQEKFAKLNSDNVYVGVVHNDNNVVRANDFLESGDVEKALEYYNRYLDGNPGDDEIRNKVRFIENEKKRVQQEGELIKGKVISIKEFGLFVQLCGNVEGMVHISQLSTQRINACTDVVNVGDDLWVVCMERDKMGRLSYSAKDGEALINNRLNNLKL